MDDREQKLQFWLQKTCGIPEFSLQQIPGDASFRRYFRVQHHQGSYVAMDVHMERNSCAPYIAIARALSKHGLVTPEIIRNDLSQGFLLITDFGDRQLLKELNEENAQILYTQALEALSYLQQCRQVSGWTVPIFTTDFMLKELDLFKEWFLERYLHLSLSEKTEQNLLKCFQFIVEGATQQPNVFMHRDYHSANLMVLPHDQVGILDFQDAFIGPVTYDLVSLLRDCYIAWPEDFVVALILQYRDRIHLEVSDVDFLYWFDLMGLQRHLKTLLTFSRKYCRDGNDSYLKHIPRTLNYIMTVSERYPECRELHALSKDVTQCVV